jgi:hypothetical protein
MRIQRYLRLNAIVALVAIIVYGVVSFATQNAPKPKFGTFAEFKSLLSEGVKGIEISSYSECKKSFRILLNVDKANQFLNAAQGVDTKGMPGHSFSIHETEVILKTATKEVKYRATVSDKKPSDLFLRRVVKTKNEDGAMRDMTHEWHEIRIPDMGTWMIQTVPEGKV